MGREKAGDAGWLLCSTIVSQSHLYLPLQPRFEFYDSLTQPRGGHHWQPAAILFPARPLPEGVPDVLAMSQAQTQPEQPG